MRFIVHILFIVCSVGFTKVFGEEPPKIVTVKRFIRSGQIGGEAVNFSFKAPPGLPGPMLSASCDKGDLMSLAPKERSEQCFAETYTKEAVDQFIIEIKRNQVTQMRTFEESMKQLYKQLLQDPIFVRAMQDEIERRVAEAIAAKK